MKYTSLKTLTFAGLLISASWGACAQNYFICQAADGNRVMTNSELEAKKYKSCQIRQLETTVTIASPKAVPSPRAGTPSAGPASFPKVEADAQRNRDTGRRTVLEDELRAEETKCAALRSEFGAGEPERLGSERNYAKYQERVAQMKEDLARCESNTAALKNELSKIRSL